MTDTSSDRDLAQAAEALEARTRELRDQRAWFEVTLSSIGDAVITADTDERVTFLNPVAERMTGWKLEDAKGRRLEEVFRIVNEDTGQPVGNPIRAVLSTGRMVDLANHTALVAKDGTSVAIDESAAPIKDSQGRIIGVVIVFHDVTDRRAADRALRASEERWRAIFDQVPVGVALVDLDTKIQKVNQRFVDIIGYSMEELPGMTFKDITHPEDLSATTDYVERLAAGHGSGYSTEKRYIRKDGAVIWSLTTAEILRDETGRPTQYIGIVEDITERKRAREEILEASQRRELALAAGNLSDWRWDIKTDLLTMGPRLLELFDLPPGAAVRANQIREFLVIDDAERQRASVQKALKERAPFSLEYRIARPGAPKYWLAARGQGVFGDDGALVGLIGVVHEITTQKETEIALSRFAAVVESSDDAIISKNLSSVIQTWNPAATRMFGYTDIEAIGRSVIMLIPDGHVDEEASILERLRRGEHIDHYETVRQRKDGSLLDVSLSVSPIRDANGHIIGASKIARDVTRQKKAEKELRDEIVHRERAEAALRETDRRKDEFLATLAHELRNPLAPIRQAALISKSPTATEAQKRWSHDVISRQVHHMAILLDDLLDISRITRGTLELRKEMTDIVAVVEAAVETARPAIDAKRHVLKVETPSEPVHFEADPLRLAQVLSNLLTNAAKYTDPEGLIRLRVTVADGSVVITVSDNGIGIPADALQAVFAMFSQVKSGHDRSEGGLGIGLALARGLVELHEGTIDVSSEGIGQGSEFTARLPLRTRKAPRDANGFGIVAAPGARRRVLIADDNRDAADSLALLLQMEGHEVTVVHDGKDALAAFSSVRPEVALLDIGMPGMNGYEVARHVRQGSLGRAVTLIAVTGWGQDTDKAQALAAGFNHHFTKPIEPERLSALLRSDSL